MTTCTGMFVTASRAKQATILMMVKKLDQR